VAPIYPTSIHIIINFGGNAGVLAQAATEAKTIPEFKNALQFGLPYWRKPLTTL